MTALVVTKLDVLSGLDRIQVCTSYRGADGAEFEDFPYHQTVLHHTTAELTELPGWKEDLGECRTLVRPARQAAREYLDFIAEQIGAPVDPRRRRSRSRAGRLDRGRPRHPRRGEDSRLDQPATRLPRARKIVRHVWKVIAVGRKLGVLVCTTLVSSARPLAAPALAAGVSTNWAGYVALPSAREGHRFSSISASWVQPRASCGGRETFSAVWVGLGGYHEAARDLEQIGTDADCSSGGAAYYSGWYELLPATPVTVPIKISPGDAVTAAVTVRRHHVTFGLRDLSTGQRFTRTRRDSALDLSSADWIVEAPSVCGSGGGCSTLPLTNFGDVSFSAATATADGHTGTIADRDWRSSALVLNQADFNATRGRTRPRSLEQGSSVTATPSSLAADGTFSVAWAELTGEPETPSTTPGAEFAPSIEMARRAPPA